MILFLAESTPKYNCEYFLILKFILCKMKIQAIARHIANVKENENID